VPQTASRGPLVEYLNALDLQNLPAVLLLASLIATHQRARTGEIVAP
jgi:hypothetical protein